MSRRRFSTVPTLINHLLDRFENGGGTTQPNAGIDNDGFATVDQRDFFDEALEELERRGGVDLIRSGQGHERVVTGVRLKDAVPLYTYVARQPAAQQVDDALVELRRSHAGAPAIVQMLDAVAEAWSRGVSFGGITRNDVRTLEHVIGLAQAIYSRSTHVAAAEIDFRTFSRLSVGDSKALERNFRAVASAVSRLFEPEGIMVGLELEEFLGTIGISRLPQPVLLKGPIKLAGEPLPATPFIGIPGECADRVELARRPAYVMTIENYASFVRYVREVASSDDGLVIFAGGFPSRPTLNLIANLARAARAPTFHWGDMDAGGVRIFHHIERRLATVGVTLLPHMMNAELLRRFGSTVPNASRLTGNVTGSALVELAEVVRDTGFVHEQEEFDPRAPWGVPLRSDAPAIG